jgi:hypothetical protein
MISPLWLLYCAPTDKEKALTELFFTVFGYPSSLNRLSLPDLDGSETIHA